MTQPSELVLRYEAKPMLVNRARTVHHHERARHDREWREAFAHLALEAGAPTFERVLVTVDHVKAGKGKLPDCASCLPSAKAGLDGCCDAGVLEDDSPAHVLGVLFNAPTRGDVESVTLTIVEIG